MMKFLSFLIFVLLIVSSSKSQEAETIMIQSYAKCKEITNGYYEMIHDFKPMTSVDTFTSTYKTYFKRTENDTIFPSLFNFQRMVDGKTTHQLIYTGNDFVDYLEKDSTGVIMNTDEMADKIISRRHNYQFFTPFTQNDCYPLYSDSSLQNLDGTLTLVKEEEVNGHTCYHLQLINFPEQDSLSFINIIKSIDNFWINKSDKLPIKYSSKLDLIMNGDTMVQFKSSSIHKFELNHLETSEKIWTLEAIPSYIQLKDYQVESTPELLSNNLLAPEWTLESFDGLPIKLSDFKGKIVLLDFFYKSCYPCLLTLPFLQDLHEKYNDKGLEVIGINPFDKDKEDLKKFLAKRGVTYTVLFDHYNV